jgi:hypothetical protein
MDIKAGDAKKIVEIILIFAILIVFLLIVYLIIYKDIFLIFTQECDDRDCFNQNLAKCRRARWVNEATEATWIYTIKGKSQGSCEVAVKLAVVKEGEIDLRRAEGDEMKCYLPLNSISDPQKDLSRCTGVLKEEIQDLTIKKLHSIIFENMKKICEEINQTV